MTDKNELDDLLARLYMSLEELKAEGADTNKLAHLITEIGFQVERHNNDIENDVTLLENLQSKLEKIEIEHPGITGALNDILMKLSSMGI